MEKKNFKYGVFYTDGGYREREVGGAGWGLHGYMFNEMTAVRYAGVPHLVTPSGYFEKATGVQLKDDSYNPKYKEWDVEVELMAPISKTSNGITLVDAFRPLGAVTAQVGEIRALLDFIREIRDNAEFSVEKVIVYTDSKYVCDGWNKDIINWEKSGWRKSNGEEVKNLELWKELFALRAEAVEWLTVRKIAAHTGEFGNESADRNATYGVVSSINASMKPPVKISSGIHIITSDLVDSDYWESDKSIVTMARTKWVYTMTNREPPVVTIDNLERYAYLTGDHNKSADDVELLGKAMPDAGFAYLLLNQKIETVEMLRKYHEENMWEHDCDMYKSEIVSLVNVANISKPGMLWEFKRVPLYTAWFVDGRNDIDSISGGIISKMLRPPRLSYRMFDEEIPMMNTVLLSVMNKLGREIDATDYHPMENVVVEEVTDKFYEREMKKNGQPGANRLTKFYEQVDRSLTFEVLNPCTEKRIKVIYSANIHLPTRNHMSAMAAVNPRVWLVTWPFSKMAFNYAMVIETDEGIGLWMANYRCTRFLDEVSIS